MKITLISPLPDIRTFGIRTLSACLKKEGHDARLIFLPVSCKDKYQEKVLDEVCELSGDSDLIGISLISHWFERAVQITQHLKKNLNTPVIWGGSHPTLQPEECLDFADSVCIGEGEDSLIELITKMKEGKNYHNIHGMWFKEKEKIVRNRPRPLIQHLDSIPFPDYAYENQYILSAGSVLKIDENILKKHIASIYGMYYATIPIRGCPFDCSYCCHSALNKMHAGQAPMRKRSAKNIIEELVQAKEKMPFINCIHFQDDSFLFYREEEIMNFSTLYKNEIKLPFMICGATPTTITKKKLSLLIEAGLTGLRMGIETGSDRIKKLYKRNYSNQKVEEVTRMINGFKDKIRSLQYDIILDNPWETEDDLIQTLMLLSKIPPPYVLCIFSLTFYPGTDLYIRAKQEGIINNDIEHIKSRLRTRKEFNKAYLNKIFLLLGDYAARGLSISPKTMLLLTDKKLRRLRLSHLLYFILKCRLFLQKVLLFINVYKRQ